MPYKVVVHLNNVELVETHYIHAENKREARFKSFRFESGRKVRKVDYIRVTELEVKEQCGVYED